MQVVPNFDIEVLCSLKNVEKEKETFLKKWNMSLPEFLRYKVILHRGIHLEIINGTEQIFFWQGYKVTSQNKHVKSVKYRKELPQNEANTQCDREIEAFGMGSRTSTFVP